METNNIHINHESDFTVVFTFPEGERPFYAWQLAFVAGRTSRYVASFDGEKYHNTTFKECREDQVRIEFKHHRLGCGLLRYEFKREAPNALFSDGQQGLTDAYTSNIILHEGPSDDSPIPDELIPITQAALRGFSAYEIAVSEGFIGSELDWLETLKGENGHTPQKGVDYFTAAEVADIAAEAAGLVPLPDVSGQISEHDGSRGAHSDIRETIASEQRRAERAEQTLSESIDKAAAAALSGAKIYTDEAVAAIPTPDVSGQISDHNAAEDAHADIREAINKASPPTADIAEVLAHNACVVDERLRGLEKALGDDSAFEVLSLSECTLEERITRLEILLAEMVAGRYCIPNLTVGNLQVWGDDSGMIVGASAPAVKPDRTGQQYLDATNRVLYVATNNNAILDWKIL